MWWWGNLINEVLFFLIKSTFMWWWGNVISEVLFFLITQPPPPPTIVLGPGHSPGRYAGDPARV
jgi:hypothetical protein